MKILFLEIDTEQTWGVASLGPAFLAPYLRREGHEVHMLRVAVAAPLPEVVRSIVEAAPSLVGLSLTTRQWLRARDVVAALRKVLDVPVIAGGLHPTFAPEQVLATPGFDIVCLGEGEEAMRDLVRTLNERGRLPPLGPAIPNLWRKGGPRPPLRAPLAPLDAQPFLARDLLDERHGVVQMTTQRGCPFPCSYCAARLYDVLYEGTGDYGRRRSPENVVAEIHAVQQRGPVHYITFLDDTFTLHHPWVRAYARLHGAQVKIPFSIHARVETVNRELLASLAQAGCRHIVYGVESGSERVRREILRRPVTNQRFEEVFQWTRDVGITTVANYMLGLPGETRADVEATLALHQRIAPDDFGHFVFYPYPGTPLFALCREHGYLPADYLERPAVHRTSILNLPDLSHTDIAELYEQFTALRVADTLHRSGRHLATPQREALIRSLHGAAAVS